LTNRPLPWHALSVVAAVVLCTLPSRLAAGDPPPQKRPLRWGADAEGGGPYVFKDPKNPSRNIGFEVDLAAVLAKEMGRPIEFVQKDFKNLLLDLNRGDIDLAMNGLEVTPDRKAKVRFTRPYYIYKLQFVTRAGEKRFATLQQCKDHGGLTVGTMEETAAERLLDALGIAKKIYDGPVECYQDLLAGRTDGVLLDLPIAAYYAKPNPRLRFAGPPLAEGYYAIAVKKENEPLAVALDAALERLLNSGELERIYTRWGLWNEDQEKLRLASVQDITQQAREPFTFDTYFPYLLGGAGLTVFISCASMLLAIALGLPIALARLYGPGWLRALATAYVEFFRGTPVLLLLLFLYYGLAGISEQYELLIDLRLGPLQAAILGFGLNYAAYESEIYRAGINSIPAGQWEAAASLGMSSSLSFRRIILPQAVRAILPPMTNDFVALFKDTSLVSVIGVVELNKRFQILTKSGGDWVEIGLATATLYLVMSVPLGYLSRYLERRWAQGATGG
jgi:polar amino acid transport system substrate-binding protein